VTAPDTTDAPALRERLIRMRADLIAALDHDFDAGAHLTLLAHVQVAIIAIDAAGDFFAPSPPS
jgi:hypothetical protein